MIRHIYWDDGSLYILDQRELPLKTRFLRCRDADAVAAAIRGMALRGAPLIGVAAAYGYALAARHLRTATPGNGSAGGWRKELSRAERALLESRPTAVNLRYAVERMKEKGRQLLASGVTAGVLAQSLKHEADTVFEEDLAANRRMAELGASLLPPRANVITYCNTGALATSGIGTALGVIRHAWRRGRIAHVYPCETRPYLQGSRLTLWELMQEKIPATLLTDNMAAHLMSTERIDAVLVGADRIAANADTANKIGTYGLAILARHHGIPFYVVAPSTTVDLRIPNGRAIPIEERSVREVTHLRGRALAPAGAKARHPAFDVTPHALISAIVTERGVIRPPGREGLRRALGSR